MPCRAVSGAGPRLASPAYPSRWRRAPYISVTVTSAVAYISHGDERCSRDLPSTQGQSAAVRTRSAAAHAAAALARYSASEAGPAPARQAGPAALLRPPRPLKICSPLPGGHGTVTGAVADRSQTARGAHGVSRMGDMRRHASSMSVTVVPRDSDGGRVDMLRACPSRCTRPP